MMGLVLSELQRMVDEHYLTNKCCILDIGSSNLYQASKADLKKFFKDLGEKPPSEEQLSEWEYGSGYDSVTGGRNLTFVGEILEHCDIEYLSFDIADGYKTKIFDLNKDSVHKSLRNKFDVVANYGTTEHVTNQLNAFRTIHDATKVGGVMIHSLPAEGYVDHCYVRYTARFFFDLVSSNNYDLLSFEFVGSTEGSKKNIYDSCRDFVEYFPALQATLNNAPKDLKNYDVPDLAIRACLRKRENKSFQESVEISTSVGKIFTSNNFRHPSTYAFKFLKKLKSSLR